MNMKFFKYKSEINFAELLNLLLHKNKKEIDVSIQLYIEDNAKPYSLASKKCLCFTEKYQPLFSKRILNEMK